MHLRSHLFFLSLLTPSLLYSAQPLQLEDVTLKALTKSFHLAIPVPGASNPVVHAINSLKFVQERTDHNQVTHIRMQQEYFGFIVFRGYAIIHSSKPSDVFLGTDNDVRVTGVVFRGLEEEIGRPPIGFVTKAPQILENFKLHYQNMTINESQITPLVYINENHKAFWAYKINFHIDKEDAIPEQPVVIIDAKTLETLLKWNNVKTERLPVKGAGFGGNLNTKKYEYGNTEPYLNIERESQTQFCAMENANIKVIDMEHSYRNFGKVMQFKCNNSIADNGIYWTGYNEDGYDLENGAYSPTNDALFIGEVIYKMYEQWFGRPPLSSAGRAIKLIMRVHFGKNYENAFWDGKQMTFGDGGRLMYPLVSLGVGAHEISHGFTEQNSRLIYTGESGGLNESFSDMAAKAAEYFVNSHSDWKIGSEIFKKDSGYDAIRYMDKPSRDGYSIDNANEFRRDLDVHYSSGVYNRMFYLLATKPGWNIKKAFSVMVKANMDYWTPYSTFNEAGCGVISAAQDLNLSVEDVKQSLTQVAINYAICDKAPEPQI